MRMMSRNDAIGRPVTGIKALVILGILTAGAAAWISGAALAAYRWAYVALAYPPVVVVGQLTRLRHRTATVPTWSSWMAHIAGHYVQAQHKPYATLVLLEAGALAFLLAVSMWRVGWFLFTRPGRIAPGQTHGDAHMATERELRALRDRGGPLLLGRVARRGGGGPRVCLDQAIQALNTLLVGPPGSGKTAGFIITNLLRELGDRSLVVTDLKGELLRLCGRVLRHTHTVWAVNFLDPRAMGYNPLAGCVTPMDTFSFCDAWVSNTGQSRSDPFWDSACKEIMSAAIFHLQATAPEAPTLGTLYAFLCAQSPEAVIAQLKVSPAPLARDSALSFMAALEANEKLLGGAFAEIKPRFRIMSDPRVQAVTSRHDVDFARLADASHKPVALFLQLDRTLQEELKPLAAAFFLDAFRTLSQLADASATGELARPVACYLDEFGNLGVVPKMATWISTLRSAGVSMLLAVQHTAQLVALYGEDGAATIIGSCATKIGLSGMGLEDARTFSDLCGQTTRVTQQASSQRQRFAVVSNQGGLSQAETAAPLMTADQVRRLRPDELLAVVRHLPPVRLQQCRWYQDREQARRVKAA